MSLSYLRYYPKHQARNRGFRWHDLALAFLAGALTTLLILLYVAA